MLKQLLYTTCLFITICCSTFAQQRPQQISFEHFNESRGDADNALVLEIPHSKIIVLENALNSRSGFGLRLNFNGTTVIVDQMEVLRDGRTQVVLRREDGRNFYGYRPTIKAILSDQRTNQKQDDQLVKN